jgi:hypothetical protein
VAQTPSQEEAPPDHSVEPAVTPISCGSATPAPNGSQSVLFVGDSISCMNTDYFPSLFLFENAGIQYAHVGGCDSDPGLDKQTVWWTQGNTDFGEHCTDPNTADSWLNFEGMYDIIFVNFGMHDVEQPHDYSETMGPSQHTDIDLYATRISTILTRLQAKARVVMWATTTPAPVVDPNACATCRQNSMINEYNGRAITALPAGAVVCDLNAFTDEHCGVDFLPDGCEDWYGLGTGVHFTEEGTIAVCNEIFDKVVQNLVNTTGSASTLPESSKPDWLPAFPERDQGSSDDGGIEA